MRSFCRSEAIINAEEGWNCLTNILLHSSCWWKSFLMFSVSWESTVRRWWLTNDLLKKILHHESWFGSGWETKYLKILKTESTAKKIIMVLLSANSSMNIPHNISNSTVNDDMNTFYRTIAQVLRQISINFNLYFQLRESSSWVFQLW